MTAITIHGRTITADAVRVADNPEWGVPHTAWRVTLCLNGRSMTVLFHLDLTHIGPPTVAGVLECLAADAASIAQGETFEEWCDGLEFVPSSRQTVQTYWMCHAQTMKLRRLLGEDLFDTLLRDPEGCVA